MVFPCIQNGERETHTLNGAFVDKKAAIKSPVRVFVRSQSEVGRAISQNLYRKLNNYINNQY